MVQHSPTTSDVHVVVRTIGERTAPAARRQAEAQVGAGNVTSITETPFARSVQRTAEIGVEKGKRWTLALDADVLLRSGAISDLIAAGEATLHQDPSAYGVSGQVADKLLGRVRAAGQHLYRTDLMAKALESCDYNPNRARPESHVHNQMGALGHAWHHVDTLMGLHDFEQYFYDVFRTALVHARKHEYWMEVAERLWREHGRDDPDIRVAYFALGAARSIDGVVPRPSSNVLESVQIDSRKFSQDVSAFLVPAGMTEREPVGPDAFDDAFVARELDAFAPWTRLSDEQALVMARRIPSVGARAFAIWRAAGPRRAIGELGLSAAQRLFEPMRER